MSIKENVAFLSNIMFSHLTLSLNWGCTISGKGEPSFASNWIKGSAGPLHEQDIAFGAVGLLARLPITL